MKNLLALAVALLLLFTACQPPAKEKILRAEIIVHDTCNYYISDTTRLCFQLFNKAGKEKHGFEICTRQKRADTMRVALPVVVEDGDQWMFADGYSFCSRFCMDSMLCNRRGGFTPKVSVDSPIVFSVSCSCRY